MKVCEREREKEGVCVGSRFVYGGEEGRVPMYE